MRKIGSEFKGLLYEILAISIWMALLILATIVLYEVSI